LSAETPSLSPELASGFAKIALSHITREYPNLLYHVLNGPDDVRSPRELHPVFFGSMDWHSCVHGYWLLASVLRLYPDNPHATAIRELFDNQLTPAGIAGELSYLDRPLRSIFERPYGWAWLLMFAAELKRHGTAEAQRWDETLAPLTRAFVSLFTEFLPKATYPTRVGTHYNTAFALTLALEYAEVAEDSRLRTLVAGKAITWYRNDRDCQAWEPSADDFLSPALMEAECMRRVLTAAEFVNWFSAFLPRIVDREPRTLFVPATVSDRSDGKIAHLDGLNLSRAWCWRSIAAILSDDDPRQPVAIDAARVHLDASLPHVAGDYMGAHWLATFALLALI
jgi:Protein of unknown function (DUF2891)